MFEKTPVLLEKSSSLLEKLSTLMEKSSVFLISSLLEKIIIFDGKIIFVEKIFTHGKCSKISTLVACLMPRQTEQTQIRF